MKEATVRAVASKSQELKNHISRFKLDHEKSFSEDSIEWDIELSENEIHDDEGQLLTALVRRTYIHHLQKSLLQNYNIWFKSYGDGVELSESFIARCALELEKKALRACMLASLYQHSIVSLIKSIKKSTDNKKLYEDLLSSFNSSKKCDKSVQADNIESVSGLSQPPSAAPDPTKTDISYNVHSSIDTSSLDLSALGGIMDFESILTAKSLTVPPQPVPSPFSVPANSMLPPKFVFSYLPKNSPSVENKCPKLSNISESSAEVSSSKIYDPEIDVFVENQPQSTLLSEAPFEEKKSVKRKSYPRNSSLKRRKSSVIQAGRRRTLEERLKKFEEIFGDSCKDIPPNPVPPDKPQCNYTKFFSLVSWKQESIAQTCELNKRLMSLPPARLKSVKACFKELFGCDDPINNITPEDFTHCRKRMANLIVWQLTPYFEFGQIGSKEVFKSLAREITRIILNETYAGDMAYSQKIVDDVFQNSIKYKTLEDVNALCSR